MKLPVKVLESPW